MGKRKHIETELGTEKLCTRCGEYWPADEEFFYRAKEKKDGLNPWCKCCYLEWKKTRPKKLVTTPAPIPAHHPAPALAAAAHG